MKELKLKDLLKIKIKRNKEATKHDFGSSLIISGSKLYPGATVLTTLGCLYTGPGLTFLATPKKTMSIIKEKIPPEVIWYPSKSSEFFTLADLKIVEFIKKRRINSIAVGTGLGVEKETKTFLIELAKNLDNNTVMDADALNILSETDIESQKFIVTPHEYEAARLLKIERSEISKNRLKYAIKLAERFGVCVLKGHRTIVATKKEYYINKTGNPGMAKGGCGDILTGMIAGLLPQLKDPFITSCIAVYLHAVAGDIASKILTEQSSTPSFLIKMIPLAFKKSGIIYNR
ncbi:MAG: NAD(P)H-hydrate dehydratase [bacterium]|nr:NAD(P)H-hydrate dehydratase [bacterium]